MTHQAKHPDFEIADFKLRLPLRWRLSRWWHRHVRMTRAQRKLLKMWERDVAHELFFGVGKDAGS